MAPRVMPAVPVRGTVVFPMIQVNIDIGRLNAIGAVRRAMEQDELIFLVMQADAGLQEPTTKDVFCVGVVARITKTNALPGGLLRITAEGLCRAPIFELTTVDDAYFARIGDPFEAETNSTVRIIAMRNLICDKAYTLAQQSCNTLNVRGAQQSADDNSLCDIIAGSLFTNPADVRAVMEQPDCIKRMELLYGALVKRCEVFGFEREIEQKVHEQMEHEQREYYLREQLKVIRTELGDTQEDENEQLRSRINGSNMPQSVKDKALKELARLSHMPPGMPEISLTRNYIDWLLELPWVSGPNKQFDVTQARKTLDEDHYGLEDIKKRIIEYLAVCNRTGSNGGTILCLVGPPGVGKTSIAGSVARALGKPFVRMSLGGVRDEAEIRGHRRTYVGAIPGRIIYTMKQAGVNDPVFLLDEIDKMSNDFRGDPASAMLEVLDPAQNSTFADHYIELPYDLSKVLFITTANSAESIPGPLKDRMEIINISGYTDAEKAEIARHHLIKKQLEKHNLTSKQLSLPAKAVSAIINDYTREAGVRSLERRIAEVCRWRITNMQDEAQKVTVNAAMLPEILRGHSYKRDKTLLKNKVGCATGLAWTSVGGETLAIETAVVPGKGELVLTGKLGDVMQESAKAAYTLVRSRAEKAGLPADYFEKHDIHLHVPEGATPKDGPSAGVSILTSIMSAVTGRLVRGDTAMTGEITLSGRVLAIGGLKEKALAAKRAGINRIAIPASNREDIADIPQEVAQTMEFVPVEDTEALLKNTLVWG